MTSPDPSDRATRYLLDELPEADRDAFEEEFFGGPDAWAALQAAEDGLIDRYCDGALSPEQRRRFEERFLATAAGRERVGFERALKELSAARDPARTPRAPAARRLPWAAALAASIAALVFVVVEARDARRARGERAALAEQLASQQQRAREQERHLAGLRGQLARVQEQSRVVTELLGGGAESVRAASLVLAAGLRRDAASPTLVLAPDVALARLELRLDGPTRAVYRATLQTPEGRELWARDGLPPAAAGGKASVAFMVPTAVLAPGHYVVTLGPAARRDEPDAEYVFRVRRSNNP